MKKTTSALLALMKMPKKEGMMKAPKLAIAEDQPRTAGCHKARDVMNIQKEMRHARTPS